MYYYSAYNLRIQSDLPLPELTPAHSGGDIEVCLSSPVPMAGDKAITWDADSRMASFCYPGAGQFLVRDGQSILVVPEVQSDLPLLRLYIEGMMFAAVLQQRGYFVLHASVVRIREHAIAFVGPVGAGKSTLAAAFHAQEFCVAADDNAAVDLAQPHPVVLPAFPSIKVYPAVAESLGYGPGDLHTMHFSQTKCACPISEGFPTGVLPLSAVYVLDRDWDAGVTPLSSVQAMVEMIRHSVPTRWGVSGDRRHLEACGRFSAAVPAFRVRTFRTLDGIPRVMDEVMEHQAQFAPLHADWVKA